MAVIDDYLKNVSPPQRSELERVRKIINQVVPEAEEVITYGMPGFKYKRRYLIAFAPFKDHMSIFPGSEAVRILDGKLKEFISSKGTIQFTIEQPIPELLIKEIVLNRIDSINKGK